MADSQMLQTFKAARQVSTPLIAIGTPDPRFTIDGVRTLLKKDDAIFEWDQVRGIRARNEKAAANSQVLGLDGAKALNPITMLDGISKLPGGSVLFFHNAHRFLDNIGVVQGVWNLRDEFKKDKRTLVLLGPSFKVPLELANDLMLLDEPLPTRGDLDEVLVKQCTQAKAWVDMPTADQKTKILDAVVGLPKYTAESVLVMSLDKEIRGINLDMCWDRKIKAIENTDGLRVWRGKENMSDLKGLDNVIGFMQKMIAAQAFGAIVFIDEIEKAMAGGLSDHTGDSGVSKDQVGVLLSYIEDTESYGVLLAGVAGSGKSQLAKAVGRAAGKPVIVFDLGAMKGGTVGSSERTIRAALKIITATAEGRVLFVATANKTATFTPELNRRFSDQFFFDLLDDSGREAIWPVYGKRYSLEPEQLKFRKGMDRGWTGAEIKRVCARAALFKETVTEASRYLVPSAISAKAQIEELRASASGRFLSASYPGLYAPPTIEEVTADGREIDLGPVH